jgi:hypothetical protein
VPFDPQTVDKILSTVLADKEIRNTTQQNNWKKGSSSPREASVLAGKKHQVLFLDETSHA